MHMSPVAALHLTLHTPDPERGFVQPLLQRKVFDSIEPVQAEISGSDPSGTVEITGIPAGRYSVQMPDPENGTWRQGVEMDITRDGQELDSATGDKQGSLNVTVVFPGATPPGRFAVALRNRQGRVVMARAVNNKGVAHFVGIPPGEYAILAFGQSRLYQVTQITAGQQTIPGHNLSVSGGSDQAITVSVSSTNVNVEGVVNKKGKGSAGAMVVLVPKDPSMQHELFRRDQTDLDGTFSLQGVVPGTYTVVAIENGWDLDWSSPGVISHYAAHGQTVTVPDSARSTIHLSEPIEVQPI